MAGPVPVRRTTICLSALLFLVIFGELVAWIGLGGGPRVQIGVYTLSVYVVL